MQAKIIFLGTGGDAIVVGQQYRASGGLVIIVDDNQFFIDPGPGSLSQAKHFGINPRANTALISTHNHINHCNDINAMAEAMTHAGLDQHGVLVTNKTVYNGTDEMRPYLTEFHKKFFERSIAFEQGQKIGINDIEIRALPAFHTEPNTIGLKFFTSKFTLAYSSDTGYHQHLNEAYKESDILILNVQFPFGNKKMHHMSSDDVVKIVEKVNPKLTIITHFGIKMLHADPISEAREIQKRTKSQIIAATDGLVISPLSYSAGLRTKTLNLY